jgi:hypothetical protein
MSRQTCLATNVCSVDNKHSLALQQTALTHSSSYVYARTGASLHNDNAAFTTLLNLCKRRSQQFSTSEKVEHHQHETVSLFDGIGFDWIGLDWIGLDWIGLD